MKYGHREARESENERCPAENLRLQHPPQVLLRGEAPAVMRVSLDRRHFGSIGALGYYVSYYVVIVIMSLFFWSLFSHVA